MSRSFEEPVIETRGLSKVYRDFWLRPRVRALDRLDLTVSRGSVHGLLGPNGSGKSTTIKLLLGLLRPTRGIARVLGRRPRDIEVKRRIGFLPEESYLYPFLDAHETLEHHARLHRLDRRTRRRRIERLLDLVGLAAVGRRPVGEFSKGMQRRLGLATSLLHDPELLILDEPTSGLDPIGIREVKDLLLRLREDLKSVLVTSHLLADVEEVCDRVTILYGGRKRAEGALDTLLAGGERTRLESPPLSAQTLAEIERLVAAREGVSIEAAPVTRQRLEAYFLDVVHAAESEGASTPDARRRRARSFEDEELDATRAESSPSLQLPGEKGASSPTPSGGEEIDRGFLERLVRGRET